MSTNDILGQVLTRLLDLDATEVLAIALGELTLLGLFYSFVMFAFGRYVLEGSRGYEQLLVRGTLQHTNRLLVTIVVGTTLLALLPDRTSVVQADQYVFWNRIQLARGSFAMVGLIAGGLAVANAFRWAMERLGPGDDVRDFRRSISARWRRLNGFSWAGVRHAVFPWFFDDPRINEIRILERALVDGVWSSTSKKFSPPELETYFSVLDSWARYQHTAGALVIYDTAIWSWRKLYQHLVSCLSSTNDELALSAWQSLYPIGSAYVSYFLDSEQAAFDSYNRALSKRCLLGAWAVTNDLLRLPLRETSARKYISAAPSNAQIRGFTSAMEQAIKRALDRQGRPVLGKEGLETIMGDIDYLQRYSLEGDLQTTAADALSRIQQILGMSNDNVQFPENNSMG